MLKHAARFGPAADATDQALALYEQKGIVASAAHARAMVRDLRTAVASHA